MSSYGAGPSEPAQRIQALPLNPDFQPKKKKQRVKSAVVHSQPADTGMGKNENTRLVLILDTLKKRSGPVSLSDLSIITGGHLMADPELLARFEALPAVTKNPINGLYSYQHEHEAVASRDDLLKEIKSHSRRGGGISIQSLRTRWAGAPAVIEKLEEDGLVLVTRTVKEGQAPGQGQPKMVFWNDLQPSEGGKQIEGEFLDMWSSLRWPLPTDLEKSLLALGQTPAQTSSSTLSSSSTNKKEKGKKKANRMRHAKIQNTHLDIDLTRDYVPPPQSGDAPKL